MKNDKPFIPWTGADLPRINRPAKNDYPQHLRPTTKFIRPGITPWPQVGHMAEELGEISKALREGDVLAAGIEIADLQLSAETLFANLNLDGNEMRRRAVAKNNFRRYYDDEGQN